MRQHSFIPSGCQLWGQQPLAAGPSQFAYLSSLAVHAYCTATCRPLSILACHDLRPAALAFAPHRPGLLAVALSNQPRVKVFDLDSEHELCSGTAPGRGEATQVAWDLTDESSLLLSVGSTLLRWRYFADRWETVKDFGMRCTILIWRQNPAKPTQLAAALSDGRIIVIGIAPPTPSAALAAPPNVKHLAQQQGRDSNLHPSTFGRNHNLPNSNGNIPEAVASAGAGVGPRRLVRGILDSLSGFEIVSSSGSGSAVGAPPSSSGRVLREWSLAEGGVHKSGIEFWGARPGFENFGGLGEACDISWEPLNPSGYLLVACHRGGTVLLDVSSGEPVAGFTKQPPGHRAIAFVPGQPGNFLAASSRSSTLQLWNVSRASGPLQSFRAGGKSMLHGMVVMPPRPPSAAATLNGRQQQQQALHSTPSVARRGRGGGETMDLVAAAAAAVADDLDPLLLDPEEGTEGESSLGDGDETSGVRVLVGFKDGAVMIYDLAKESVVWRQEGGHTETLFDCKLFSPQAAELLGAGGGADLPSAPSSSSSSFLLRPEILLATASFDSSVKVWDVRTGSNVRRLTGSEGVLYSVSWSCDGQLLASSSRNGCVYIYSVARGLLVRTLKNHTDTVFRVCFHPTNPSLLASASMDGTVTVCGTDGEVHRVLQLPEGNGGVRGVAWQVPYAADVPEDQYSSFSSPSSSNSAAATARGETLGRGLLLACTADSGAVFIWDVDPPEQGLLLAVILGHRSRAFNVEWSPVIRHWCMTSSDDCTARVWDVRVATRVAAMQRLYGGAATEGGDGGAQRVCLAVLSGHTDKVRALAWHQELPFVAFTGSWDGTIRVWDVRGGGRCLRIVQDHYADVYGLATHPLAPLLLVSSSRDATTRFWDTSDLCTHLTAAALVRPICELRYSPQELAARIARVMQPPTPPFAAAPALPLPPSNDNDGNNNNSSSNNSNGDSNEISMASRIFRSGTGLFRKSMGSFGRASENRTLIHASSATLGNGNSTVSPLFSVAGEDNLRFGGGRKAPSTTTMTMISARPNAEPASALNPGGPDGSKKPGRKGSKGKDWDSGSVDPTFPAGASAMGLMLMAGRVSAVLADATSTRGEGRVLSSWDQMVLVSSIFQCPGASLDDLWDLLAGFGGGCEWSLTNSSTDSSFEGSPLSPAPDRLPHRRQSQPQPQPQQQSLSSLSLVRGAGRNSLFPGGSSNGSGLGSNRTVLNFSTAPQTLSSSSFAVDFISPVHWRQVKWQVVSMANHLEGSAASKLKGYQKPSGGAGGGGNGPSRHEEALREAAVLHAVAGNLDRCCELLAEIHDWDRALALAGGSGSFSLWQRLMKKRIQSMASAAGSFSLLGMAGGRGGAPTMDLIQSLVLTLLAAGKPQLLTSLLSKGKRHDEAFAVAAVAAAGGYKRKEILPIEAISAGALVALSPSTVVASRAPKDKTSHGGAATAAATASSSEKNLGATADADPQWQQPLQASMKKKNMAVVVMAVAVADSSQEKVSSFPFPVSRSPNQTPVTQPALRDELGASQPQSRDCKSGDGGATPGGRGPRLHVSPPAVRGSRNRTRLDVLGKALLGLEISIPQTNSAEDIGTLSEWTALPLSSSAPTPATVVAALGSPNPSPGIPLSHSTHSLNRMFSLGRPHSPSPLNPATAALLLPAERQGGFTSPGARSSAMRRRSSGASSPFALEPPTAAAGGDASSAARGDSPFAPESSGEVLDGSPTARGADTDTEVSSPSPSPPSSEGGGPQRPQASVRKSFEDAFPGPPPATMGSSRSSGVSHSIFRTGTGSRELGRSTGGASGSSSPQSSFHRRLKNNLEAAKGLQDVSGISGQVVAAAAGTGTGAKSGGGALQLGPGVAASNAVAPGIARRTSSGGAFSGISLVAALNNAGIGPPVAAISRQNSSSRLRIPSESGHVDLSSPGFTSPTAEESGLREKDSDSPNPWNLMSSATARSVSDSRSALAEGLRGEDGEDPARAESPPSPPIAAAAPPRRQQQNIIQCIETATRSSAGGSLGGLNVLARKPSLGQANSPPSDPDMQSSSQWQTFKASASPVLATAMAAVAAATDTSIPRTHWPTAPVGAPGYSGTVHRHTANVSAMGPSDVPSSRSKEFSLAVAAAESGSLEGSSPPSPSGGASALSNSSRESKSSRFSTPTPARPPPPSSGATAENFDFEHCVVVRSIQAKELHEAGMPAAAACCLASVDRPAEAMECLWYGGMELAAAAVILSGGLDRAFKRPTCAAAAPSDPQEGGNIGGIRIENSQALVQLLELSADLQLEELKTRALVNLACRFEAAGDVVGPLELLRKLLPERPDLVELLAARFRGRVEGFLKLGHHAQADMPPLSMDAVAWFYKRAGLLDPDSYWDLAKKGATDGDASAAGSLIVPRYLLLAGRQEEAVTNVILACRRMICGGDWGEWLSLTVLPSDSGGTSPPSTQPQQRHLAGICGSAAAQRARLEERVAVVEQLMSVIKSFHPPSLSQPLWHELFCYAAFLAAHLSLRRRGGSLPVALYLLAQTERICNQQSVFFPVARHRMAAELATLLAQCCSGSSASARLKMKWHCQALQKALREPCSLPGWIQHVLSCRLDFLHTAPESDVPAAAAACPSAVAGEVVVVGAHAPNRPVGGIRRWSAVTGAAIVGPLCALSDESGYVTLGEAIALSRVLWFCPSGSGRPLLVTAS